MLWNFSLIWDRHHKQVDWFHLNDIGGTLDSKKWRWYSYISRSDITFDLTILLKCLWKSQRSARTTYRILHERLIIGVWPPHPLISTQSILVLQQSSSLSARGPSEVATQYLENLFIFYISQNYSTFIIILDFPKIAIILHHGVVSR